MSLFHFLTYLISTRYQLPRAKISNLRTKQKKSWIEPKKMLISLCFRRTLHCSIYILREQSCLTILNFLPTYSHFLCNICFCSLCTSSLCKEWKKFCPPCSLTITPVRLSMYIHVCNRYNRVSTWNVADIFLSRYT